MVEGLKERLGRIPLIITLAITGIIIYLPIIFVVIFSFNEGRFQVFPLKGFSLIWYQKMFLDTAFMNSLKNSVLVSLSVGFASTMMGFLGAYSLVKADFKFKDILSSFLITPLAVPGVLLAVSLRVYFYTLGWNFSLFMVFLGQLIVNIPLSLMIIRARLLQIPLSLEEAAWDLGANRVKSLSEVIIPMALPSMLVSMLLTFTFSFDEFIIAYFLTQFELTLPIKIWSNLITGYDPTVNAIGTIVFFVSLIIVFFGQRFVLDKPKWD